AYFYIVDGAITSQDLRRAFDEAKKNVPSIVLIENVDLIAPNDIKTDLQRDLVTQLLAELDDLDMNGPPNLFLVGATTQLGHVYPGLRRPGRFDREINVDLPDAASR